MTSVWMTMLFAGALALPVAGEADPHFERLPAGCKVVRSQVVDGAQREAVGRRLGIALKSLSNTELMLQGAPLQVGLFEAQDAADTTGLYRAIVRAHRGDAAFCLIDGDTVVEFCKIRDAAVARKAAYELGYVKKPSRVRYRLTARVATVSKADYQAFNELSQFFFGADVAKADLQMPARVAALATGFAFGEALAVRAAADAAYGWAPEPVGVQTQSGDRAVFAFRALPQSCGLPYATLTGTFVCAADGRTPTSRRPDASLLAATPFWPADDPDVRALARSVTAGCVGDEAKVAALLAWLKPGKNIKPEGPSGSRWGVKQVLAQRRGHCWDASDVFVALARAAGVPARQVGGWLYGTGGHVWAEVLVAGEAWRQVDPTGGGDLACGIYHVPYFVTETGEMPILYLSRPVIELLEAE